jgi:predicted nucleic acid-binding protein
MDKAVIDSSVAIKCFVVEPYSDDARRVLNEYQSDRLSLLAPDLIYAEVGHIVWEKQRFQGLAAARAYLIIEAFRMLIFSLTSSATLLDEAVRLAIMHQRTVYDALYVALSGREQRRYVTADERPVNAIGAVFPNVLWVVNWP